MDSTQHFVLCLNNKGYSVSLEQRKLYQSIPDKMAEKHKQIRIIDESGEDYLYPESLFVELELPTQIEKALMIAA